MGRAQAQTGISPVFYFFINNSKLEFDHVILQITQDSACPIKAQTRTRLGIKHKWKLEKKLKLGWEKDEGFQPGNQVKIFFHQISFLDEGYQIRNAQKKKKLLSSSLLPRATNLGV